MKIRIDIDCTPDEARTFLGLPDVKPMQEALLRDMQERMSASLNAMDPESLLKTWMPGGYQGVEQLQKMFWNNMAAAMGKDGKK